MLGKKILSVLAICFLVFSTSSCGGGSYVKQMKQSEKLFYKGKYKEAARTLLPAVNTKDKDQLLYQMECGLMLHTAGDYKTSNKVFLSAAKIADKISTSISKQAASLLLNETTTNYKGEDFERVLIHMYLGINFLMLDNPESARVEFKKVNNLLRSINVTGGKKYKQNIMAKYLTALAFEIIADKENDENDREFAYVEYKQINKLNPRLTYAQQDLVRLAKQLGDTEDYNLWKKKYGEKFVSKNSGELIVIYNAGLSAIKRSRGKILSDKAMKASIRISFSGMPPKAGVSLAGVFLALRLIENPIPRFVKRSNKVKAIEITAKGKRLGRTIQLEDIETTAVNNMQEQYRKMYAKVAAGIAVKAVASVAAGYAAKKIAEKSKKVGGFAGLIGAVVGAGVGVGLASQIKPDLRCWHTLPANLQLCRLFLKPGDYEFKVRLIGKNNRTVGTRKHKMKIVKGKKSILNYRTLF